MHPDDLPLAASLDNLAVVYAKQEMFSKAEPLYRRSLAIKQKADVLAMNNLALTLEAKGDNAAAEALYRRALALAEHIPSFPAGANVGEADALKKTLTDYALLLRKLKRDGEAAKLEARSNGAR